MTTTPVIIPLTLPDIFNTVETILSSLWPFIIIILAIMLVFEFFEHVTKSTTKTSDTIEINIKGARLDEDEDEDDYMISSDYDEEDEEY